MANLERWNGEVHPAAQLFPMLSPDEHDELVGSIKGMGLMHPIVLAPDGTLLDGRNRLKACEDAGVEPRFEVYDRPNQIDFILSQNLARRHLSADQKAMLAIELLPHYEAETARGRPKKDEENGAPVPHFSEEKKRAPRARDKAAKATGASGRQVAKAKRVKEKAVDEVAEKVTEGALSLDVADKVAALPDVDQTELVAKLDEGTKPADIKREAIKRKKMAEHAARPKASQVDGPGWRVVAGPFQVALADQPDESVDLIVTDPPYDDAALPLFGDLSQWASRVLKPSGVCAVYTGAKRLPQVLDLLGSHLEYRWTFCLDQQAGEQVAFRDINVKQAWKPVLIFHKPPWHQPPWGKDVLVSPAPEKDRHQWQQNIGPVRELVERYSAPGHVVADPFLGGGTTGLAALELDRQFIGCDIDPVLVAAFGEVGR